MLRAVAAMLLVVPAALAHADVIDRSCDRARDDDRPLALGSRDAWLSSDGGIVMAVPPNNSWRFRVGERRVRPMIEVLAPGLTVYRLYGPTYDLVLEDGEQREIATARLETPVHPLPPAPEVKRIAVDRQRVRVTLIQRPPPEVVAIVLGDARGTPRSFGVVRAGTTSQLAFVDNRCGSNPRGTIETVRDDRVTVWFVDIAGRRSPASPIVRVR